MTASFESLNWLYAGKRREVEHSTPPCALDVAVPFILAKQCIERVSELQAVCRLWKREKMRFRRVNSS